ncbi:MAG TPA: hypothetical protein VFF16_06110 [Telluria sp.]|nr:hypothetical protein [Telluria sp.]
MKKIVAIAGLAALTGCASLTGSKMQPVSVQTTFEARELAGVGCTLENDAGKWFVTTPGSVTIQKSTGDLAVTCLLQQDLVGNATVVSKSNTAVWGNIIFGGGIGYIVDRNTGAGFDYPTNITVALRKAGEPVPGGAPTAAK